MRLSDILIILLFLLLPVTLWSAPPLLPAGEVLPASTTLPDQISRRETVAALAFSPDGAYLATGAADRALVRLWDSASGHERQRLEWPIAAGVQALVMTSRWLAVGCADGTVVLQEQDSGRELPFTLHAPVTAIAAAPSGEQFAVAAGRTVYLLDTRSGRSDVLTELADPLTALAFHPGGSALAFAGGAAAIEIQIWSLRSRSTLTRWLAHTAPIRALTFHPNGSLLLSAGDDGTVRSWNPDGKALTTLAGHTGPVTALALTPDGTTLLSGGDDGLRLWDTASSAQIAQRDEPGGPVRALAFGPDGRWFASAGSDGGAWLWDAATVSTIRQLRGQRTPLTGLALHPTGTVLAVAAGANGLRLADAPNGWERSRLTEAGTAAMTTAYSPNGRWLAAGLMSGEVLLWDAASEQQHLRLDGHKAAVTALAFTPAGLTLASGSADGQIVLWDVASGDEIARLPLNAAITALALAPDGRWLVAATASTVELWDTLSGSRLHTLPATAPVLAISPDGSQLVVAADSQLHFYEPMSGNVTRTLPLPEPVQALAFTADGSQLITAGEHISLWSLADGRQLASFGSAGVTVLIPRSDGTQLLTAAQDGSVRLWTLSPPTLRWTYLPGADNNWLTCQTDNRCWRHDDGYLLSTAVGYRREPLLPIDDRSAMLVLDTPPAALTVADGSITPLTVTVRNDGPGRAYWLQLAQADANSLWVLHPPSPYPVLEPGASTDLALQLAVHTAYANPGSGMTELPLQLRAAHGAPLTFTVPVTVTSPRPTVIRAERLTSPDRLLITLGNSGAQALAELAASIRLPGTERDLGSTHGRGLLAGGTLTLEFPLTANSLLNQATQIDLKIWSTALPVHVWRFPNLPVTQPLPNWLSYALATAGLLLLLLLWWRRRRRRIQTPPNPAIATATTGSGEDGDKDDADATVRP